MWDFDLLDSNDFYVMESLKVDNFRAEKKLIILQMLQICDLMLLLPHVQCTLIICYRMRGVCLLIVTAYTVYAYNWLTYA